jgi:hypothetical protein
MRNAGSVRERCALSARVLAAALVLAVAGASMAAQAQSTATPTPPVREVSSTVLALDPSRGSGVYPVYASSDLQAGSAAGRLALVVVHGRLRNASDYFITGTQLAGTAGAKAAGGGSTATIVVAPQFLNQVDVTAHNLTDRYLRWSRNWEAGMPAQGPSPASSYDVLDDLVDKLSNTAAFPELGRIVFIGHGGGAQMLARYAAVTRLRSSRTVSFIIANSGTYLYLTTTRPLAAAVPCEDVNTWKYGLRDPPRYVGAPDAIAKNFAARDITLLLGGSDVKRSGVLDQSCAAEAQGRNRLERGQYFLEALTAGNLAPLLRHAIVRGVGHNEREMLFSKEARDAIFAAPR